MLSDPEVAFGPLQAPLAVQSVASVVDQVSVVAVPGATPGGDALSCAVGAPAPAIAIVTLATAPPPGPSQDNMNCSVCVIDPVSADPLVGCVPLQPPDAVHESTLLVLQVSVEVSPDATMVGLAERLMVGAEAEAADDDPPPPPPLPQAVSPTTEKIRRMTVLCIGIGLTCPPDFNDDSVDVSDL